MAEPTVDLRDLHGPFAGQVRPYTKSAAQNAVASGFAEYVTAATPEVVSANPPVVAPEPKKSARKGR